MNKKLVSLLLLAVVIITGFGVLNYFLSIKTAYINIKRPGVTATVYSKANKQVGSLSATGKLSLRTGEYYLVPAGTHINSDHIAFRVTAGGAYVTVNPGYSDEYLSQLLANQLPAIKTALLGRYLQLNTGYTVNAGTLYGYGDWYATTLVQPSPGPGASGDVYRVVLHKAQGVWQVSTTPAIVLSAQDYPDIPHDILQNINTQTGY